MIKLYFKQAWNLIRQERLFSLVYILGTGLSISMVMILSIILYIKLADIYPEKNRSRMLIAKSGKVEDLKNPGTVSSTALSEEVITTCFAPLKEVESIGLELRDYNDYFVQPAGLPDQLPVTVKFVNTDFWKLFPFHFVGGYPFTVADQQSGLPSVVLAQSFARRLFGDSDAVGKYLSLNFRQYKVCGVVRDASWLTPKSYAQLWIPYTASGRYKKDLWGTSGLLGGYVAYLLVTPGADIQKVKREGEENILRYNRTLSDVSFTMMGQPDYHWQSVFRVWSNEAPDFTKLFCQYAMVFFVLLLIPAVSLSGMTDSRMERRLAEIGVRRAFGAPVGTLINQIISENLLFTLLGGMLGLIFSYLLLYLSRNWIMQIGVAYVNLVPEGTEVVITPSMLMNYQVFGITLGLCFLLNLLSALIPAWRAAHREIICSLNAK